MCHWVSKNYEKSQFQVFIVSLLLVKFPVSAVVVIRIRTHSLGS